MIENNESNNFMLIKNSRKSIQLMSVGKTMHLVRSQSIAKSTTNETHELLAADSRNTVTRARATNEGVYGKSKRRD